MVQELKASGSLDVLSKSTELLAGLSPESLSELANEQLRCNRPGALFSAAPPAARSRRRRRR